MENFKSRFILIIGCMNSGKTTKLISKLYGYKFFKSASGMQPCILYKHKTKDTRVDAFGDKLISRTGIKFDNTVWIDFVDEIDYKNNNIIGLDEMHFWNPDKLYRCIMQILKIPGKIIIGTTLNGDYRKKMMPILTLTIPITHKIIYLTATCYKCGDKACYTTSMVDFKNKSIIKSDDGECFRPTCNNCYITYN